MPDKSSISRVLDEELLAMQEELEPLCMQVEILQEEIHSQNLYLRQKEQELLEIEQELACTSQELACKNQELCKVLRSEMLSLDKAKALAQTILKSKKSTSESLAELINAIYGANVKLDEFEMDKTNAKTRSLISTETDRIVAVSKELRANSRQIRDRCKELGLQFVNSKAQFMRLKYAEFRSKLKVKNDVTANHFKSNSLKYSPPIHLTHSDIED